MVTLPKPWVWKWTVQDSIYDTSDLEGFVPTGHTGQRDFIETTESGNRHCGEKGLENPFVIMPEGSGIGELNYTFDGCG